MDGRLRRKLGFASMILITDGTIFGRKLSGNHFYFESKRIVGVGCWWRMKAEDEKSEDRD